jgi:predicted nuclease with RNAse H fold
LGIDDVPKLLDDWLPDVVAIDSPNDWAKNGERETERLLRQRGVNLYQTPWDESKKSHAYYQWMVMGFAAFHAARAKGYRHFDGGPSVDGHCIEVFPYATAVVLSGGLRPSDVRMPAWRRRILEEAGVDVHAFRSPDQVDAALASLTGVLALSGSFTWLGDPGDGVIVLPCPSDALLKTYRQTSDNRPFVGVRDMAWTMVHYPDRATRRLSAGEKAKIRALLLSGAASESLAQQFQCGVIQIAGIKAAMTLAARRASAN